MNFRRIAVTAAVAIGLLASGSSTVKAQDVVTMPSSLTPLCVTADCSRMTFVLDLAGSIYVDWVQLDSFNPALWQFGAVESIRDADGNSLGWEVDLLTNGIYLKAGGYLAPEPIYITAQMERYTTNGDFTNLVWNGWGNVNSPGTAEGTVNFGGGTVTPEPVSMVLLGTGLLGVAGAARKRRKQNSV